MRILRSLSMALGLAAAIGVAAGPASAQVLSGQLNPNYKNLVDNANFNIYQRGSTAVTGITTTATYHADRWAGYSGTATSMSLTNIPASLPLTTLNAPVFSNAEQVQRTAAQTGVLPVCLVQEIPTSEVKPINEPVTLSFWALAGSNFSATSNLLTATVSTGTGTDQGLASFISGWTGAVVPVTLNATLTTSWQRFAVTGVIPATATEAAVTFCFTPTGTAGTNDYFQITGAQLEQGTAATNLEWRPAGVELAKVQRFAYAIQEGTITAGTVMAPAGQAPSGTTCLIAIPFPVTMRAAPTYTNALTASTFKLNSAAVNTALSTPFSATTGVNTVFNGSVTFTASGLGATAGFGCELVSAAGSGVMLFTADF